MNNCGKRRSWILSGLTLTLAGACVMSGCGNNASENAGEGKKLYYYHDTTSLFMPSPANPKGESVITEDMLKGAVDEAVDSGADVFISEFYGMVPLYPSEVYPMEEHMAWFEETFGKTGASAYSIFQKKGGDYVRSLCAETHAKEADFWISYRINDFHGMWEPVTSKTAKPSLTSRFYMEHLDERIGEPQSNCSWFQNLLDFRYEDVRQYKLSLIRELIENYDIDGIVVDFLRGPALYNLSMTTSDQRKELTMGFLQEIRRMLDEKSADTRKKYSLAVKLPMDMDSYDKLGIDVAAMEQQAGVNVFFVFDYYDGRQDYEALDYVQENTESSPVNLEIGTSTVWRDDGMYLEQRAMTKEEYYTTAYLAYQHGADGIALFNFPFYRDSSVMGQAFDPPFEILSELKDPEFLAGQPQHYFEAATQNKLIHDFDLQSAVWKPGDSYTFDMEMSAPAGGWTTDGTMRLESLKQIEGLDFEVQMNGTVLEPAAVEGEPYETPYWKLIGTPANWLGYTVPKDCLQEGANQVTVINHSDQEVTFYYIDLAIR